MTSRYLNLLFSDAVKQAQSDNGSRNAYARVDGATDGPDALGQAEIDLITSRDSFYMASVGAGGWPYLQHRGGPAGFVRVTDPHRLAFADYRGNRQYVSLGNFAGDDRAALFFMDYPRRTRLKLLGHVRALVPEAAPELAAALTDPSYKARIERIMVVEVEAFDWNCPQHITPRFTLEEIKPSFDRLQARIAELESDLASLRAVTAD